MSEQLNEAMQVLDFLAGTGELEGCGFGDKPAGVQGNYWWRRHLPKIRYALFTHHAAPGAPQQEASGDDDVKRAREILARLCDKGLVSMSIPVRDEDEDMVLSRVIDRAAATAPAGGVMEALSRIRKAMRQREFNTALSDEDLMKSAANIIAEDGSIITHYKARAALTTAARAAEPEGEKHTIEGVVTFMRQDDASNQACVCCPPGKGHAFCRYVKWDEWETNRPKHFGNGPEEFLSSKVLDYNKNEGKRVRVTIEVLPTPPTGTSKEGGEAA